VTEEFERWAARAGEHGVTARTVLRTGSPYQEIVGVATDEHADLVIMGTHGRGGVSRLLLGSVADRVIRFAPCPVLTVRGPSDEAEGGRIRCLFHSAPTSSMSTARASGP
jgi:nucleotide-binding universal stress UspA family protein